MKDTILYYAKYFAIAVLVGLISFLGVNKYNQIQFENSKEVQNTKAMIELLNSAASAHNDYLNQQTFIVKTRKEIEEAKKEIENSEKQMEEDGKKIEEINKLLSKYRVEFKTGAIE